MTKYAPPIIKKCPQCGTKTVFHLPMSGNSIDAIQWLDGELVGPMLPEPISVVKCSECSHVYWMEDAELYEDRVFEAAMAAYDAMPICVRVPNNPRPANPRPARPSIDAVWCLDPSFADLVKFVDRENIALDRERHIRIKIWWMWNTGVVQRRHREIPRILNKYIRKKLKASHGAPVSISREEKSQIVTDPGPWRGGYCPPKAKRPHAIKSLTRLVELFDITEIAQRLMKVEALRELGRFEEAVSLLDGVSGDRYAATVVLQRELCEAHDQEVQALSGDQRATIFLMG
jgi:hypothetical protein